MLNGKQIREVTAQGIKYIDENNTEQFIDFAQCNETYMNKHLNPEYWKSYKEWNHLTDADWNEYEKDLKSHKQVGARDITADKPFIQIYTDPPLKFDFDTLDEWHNVVHLIRRARYRTFDLS